MSDKERGLYDKYLVYKLEGNPEGDDFGALPVEDRVFVMNPQTDPGAVLALETYASWAYDNGYAQLAIDIWSWLDNV